MEFNQCINYLLTTAQHNIFQEFSNRLAPFDITPVQYGVLNCIWKENATSPKQIAELLMLENSTVSGVLERMEKKMLLVRTISKEDRRYIQVELTKRGKMLEKDILQVAETFNQDVFSTISKKESDILKELLKNLANLNFSSAQS